MNFLASLSTAILTLVLAIPAGAQDLERVKSELRKKFPDAQIETARKSGYGGLVEVTGGGEVFYTDEKTSFLLLGSLIDTKTRENVTEARVRKLSAVKFDTLPLASAIKIVRGNGSRRIAIFEDPNCGYCKRFEHEIAAGVTDLTMYVFLYPILSPDSMEKSKAVWCAPDRAKAWLDLMLKDTAPAGGKACETPIDTLIAFGREKRISGTPTIFFEDGERVPGVMPIPALEKRLADAKAAKP
ncbi:MAG TPA: DsbC family protein [Usitatibacteraceae bacterium]|nr:DsbC family protein [Usitatibacteraceae bacterium]